MYLSSWDPAKPITQFPSKRKTRGANSTIPVWVQRLKSQEHQCPRVSEDASYISSKISAPLLCFFTQALGKLGDKNPHWGGRSSLLSLPVQMLSSSRNVKHKCPEIVRPAMWAFLLPVRWTYNLNTREGCRKTPTHCS